MLFRSEDGGVPVFRSSAGRSILFLMSLVVTYPVWAESTITWHVLEDRALEVVEGSVLDFSSLQKTNWAGAQGDGQIDANVSPSFSGDTLSQRFLCASLVPSEPNGGLPDKEEADRWVEQLTRAGYNMVRLHFIEAILMTGRNGDFDFDPVGLDRLHYLMARLKSAGIYWVVDGLTSDNGAYGDVSPHRWVKRHKLKERLYYEPAALEHWKRLVTSLWGSVNPYTGLAPLNDPALLGMILVNEGGLPFLATLDGRYPGELNEPFAVWLTTRYKDDAAFRRSWGRELTERDRLGVSVAVPDEIRGAGRRARDFAAFVAERETSLYKAMEAHVRSRGFKGRITSYNNWSFSHADAVRDVVDWVDMHAYQSLPSRFAEPGSVLPQTSIFDDVGRYGRSLASARHWGKPFTVTEYGQPFWNQWRHESAAWIPALAAFQGWDAICQFAELPVLQEYAESGPPRRQATYPFGVGADPIARAGERLAALLFLRGDVTPSRTRLMFDLDPKALFSTGNAQGRTPERLSRMALVVGTGLSLPRMSAYSKTERDMHLPVDAGNASLIEKARDAALRKGLLFGEDPVAQLKSKGLLSVTNGTDMAAGRFESDTGQMVFDSSGKRLSVVTERTVALTLRSGTMRGGAVEVKDVSSPATVAVGALDDQAIGQSRRMLVWVLTDAINTGMEFADSERTTLKTLGRFPPRIRAVTGQLAIRHAEARALRVWAVDQAGRRVAAIPVRAQGGVLRFAIDNVVPGYGPVTYFEVAVDGRKQG